MHRKRTKYTFVAALLSATALTSVATPSHALVSVRAPAELAKLGEQVATARSQLTELTTMTNLTQQMNDAIGEFGPLGDVFSGAAFSKIGSQSDFYTNMEKFAFDPCAINLCTVGENSVNMQDFDEALDWTTKTYFSSRVLNGDEMQDLQEVRRRGVIYSATNGLAVANIVHSELAGSGAEADALEQIVKSKDTMRGQIRASNAIALASYKVNVQQLALLTAMLEVEATRAIADTNLIHEDGGTEFPDAYKEDDFGMNGVGRTTVTVPDKGSAGGGAGFGGGLFGASLGALGSDSGLGSVLGGNAGGIGDILGSSNPLAALTDGITNGTVPTIDPSDISVNSVLGDAMGMSSDVMTSLGNRDISSALRTVQSGLSASGGVDGSQVILGAGRAQAAASGDNTLSSILGIAESSLRGGATQATSFAESIVTDLRANGAVDAGSYLTQQLEAVRAGTGDTQTLVLDAAALIANYGVEANSSVANTLGTDTSSLSTDALQDLLARTMQDIADATNQPAIRTISDGIRDLSNSDIEALRQAASAAAANRETAPTSRDVSREQQSSDVRVFD